MNAGIAKPSEKWADRVRLLVGNPPVAHEAGVLDKPLPDRYQVTDLAKTPEEATGIAEALAGVNDFRQALCGLPPVKFAADRVHVLDEAEFQRKIVRRLGRAGVRGKAFYGHVYICREQDFYLMLAILAHELMHATAYFWLDCYDQEASRTFRPPTPGLLIRRVGLTLIDPSYMTLLPHFHGLNEMATETAAMAVRQLIAGRTNLLDRDGKDRLAHFCASPPQVQFLDRLIARIAGPGGQTVGISRDLFLDMFTGTDAFLSRLEGVMPGATEVLRATGARPEELEAAARKLGLTEMADLIRPYCHE